jgi:hypothetical protein
MLRLFPIPTSLGHVWMQSIFKVLEKYYGFTKYFSFQKLLGVWVQEILKSLKSWFYENCSPFGVLKTLPMIFFF